MCGLFGAIGQNLNPGTIRALALANRARGTDSLGFFNGSGHCVKRANDPLTCLSDKDFAEFITVSCRKGWFIAGHTRRATSGGITFRNAHPFRFGRIIGSHNGCVTPPLRSNYEVTSEYLLDSLNKANGDYQKAFVDIDGWWGLTWFDGDFLYLQAFDNEICIGRDKYGNWYYSSDWKHLEACTGSLCNIARISDGVTIRFSPNVHEYERQPTFVSSAWLPVSSKKHRKRRRHWEIY